MKRKRKVKPLIIEPKRRNPLVAPVMKRGVKKHRNRKREDKNSHVE